MDSSLSLIVCAAPLADRASLIAAQLIGAGWDVTVAATPHARAWIDEAAVTEVTGLPVLVDFRQRTETKRSSRPDAVVVCPATFNTLNKLACGISDSHALGVLNEALATKTPIVAVPLVNGKLWTHPAFARHLEELIDAGVCLLDPNSGRATATAVESGTGSQVAAAFEPQWLVTALAELHRD